MKETLSDFISKNKEKLYEVSRKNTKLNENDKPTISINDEWFNENEWDDLYNKLKDICADAPILKGKDNMIELDIDNLQHREWYEED